MKHTSNGGSTTYYDLPSGSKDIQDLVEYRNMNFAVGNIFKAAFRMGRKEGIDDIYDLNKIIYFAKREIDRINTNTETKVEAPVFLSEGTLGNPDNWANLAKDPLQKAPADWYSYHSDFVIRDPLPKGNI